MRIDLPIASASVYPNMRSAAGFHDVMMLFRSFVMIASSDDSTTAARRRRAIAARRPLADVARDFGCTDHATRIVQNGRHGQRDRDERPVLALTDGLKMSDRLFPRESGPEPVSSSGCRSAGMIIRIDLPIASSALYPNMRSAARFQERDDAVQVLADDRVVGRVDDASEMAKCDVVRRLLHAVNTVYGRAGVKYEQRPHQST